MQSEHINELATALAKAQKLIKGAVRESTLGHYNHKYADLASIVDAIKNPLADNGLSYVQTMEHKDGHQFIRTLLLHSSGQWIDGLILLNPAKNDPQTFGSYITYMRRYALGAMVGVPSVDDDADQAMAPYKQQPSEQSTPKPQANQLRPVNRTVQHVNNTIQGGVNGNGRSQ